MEIGKKLKDARMKSGFTQEAVAEKINVSRQTISNWENEKSYPDIISVIELSSLYSISLDDLLKGDERMMEHLEESTNVVKSNQKLIGAIILNIITVILLITLSMFLPDKIYYLIMVFCLAIVSSAVLLYQTRRTCPAPRPRRRPGWSATAGRCGCGALRPATAWSGPECRAAA